MRGKVTFSASSDRYFSFSATTSESSRHLGDLYAESGQTLQGSFSAVSKPNFSSTYSLESSRRDLHNALLCTVLESTIENWGKRTWPKQPRKGENERPLSSSSLPSTSAKGGCEEKLTRMKIEYAYDIWSPLFYWKFNCVVR